MLYIIFIFTYRFRSGSIEKNIATIANIVMPRTTFHMVIFRPPSIS